MKLLTSFKDGTIFQGLGDAQEAINGVGANRTRGQRLVCFVCGNTEHLQRTCPSQYCQSCGKKGHNRRDCYSKKQILTIGRGVEPHHLQRYMDEPGVMVSIKLNNFENVVMLDSGAQPSVIDTETLDKLQIRYQIHPSKVHRAVW